MSTEGRANELQNAAASASEADITPIQTKLVLLGEAAVGKTSEVHRFVQDDFQ